MAVADFNPKKRCSFDWSNGIYISVFCKHVRTYGRTVCLARNEFESVKNRYDDWQEKKNQNTTNLEPCNIAERTWSPPCRAHGTIRLQFGQQFKWNLKKENSVHLFYKILVPQDVCFIFIALLGAVLYYAVGYLFSINT